MEIPCEEGLAIRRREPQRAENAGILPKLAAIGRILLTRLGEFDLDAQFDLRQHSIEAGITGG